MGILEKALTMLEKHCLCDHCLGRQFALLGRGIENYERGKAIKLVMALEAHDLASSGSAEGVHVLKTLAANGFHESSREMLRKMRRRLRMEESPKKCFLCENSFEDLDGLAENALKQLGEYEYSTFLVGVELPLHIEEREDEFKADFKVSSGESMRNEFGRALGKKIAEFSGKVAEYKKPEMVVLVNPFTSEVRLQVNPLFIAGRYRKLVRDIPQSKWFCSNCRGKGCEKCGWTGKMYPESVEEIVGKPFLEATDGVATSFHASGREDIDVRMLGTGRPFVIEVAKPRKRFIDLKKLEEDVNASARGKVEVSGLRFANRDTIRRLKKAESTQKEYRAIMEMKKRITLRDCRLLEEKLKNAVVRQRTPFRVLHRRADLTREKYIYDVKVKKLAPKKAEMRIRCQGGLYIKELVTGDEGRTEPNVSGILENEAKPIKLDVLKVIIED